MTTVAVEGNRRVGSMTLTEAEQCISDIKSWFQRKSDVQIVEASPAEFQRLEKACDEVIIPDTFRLLLSHINGNIFFMEKEAMSIEKIIKVVTKCSMSKLWDPLFLPFCGDEDDMIIIDTDGGGVLEWDTQDGPGGEVASSFTQYLEDYRNSLLDGHMEYIDGCGVVEKMGQERSRK